MKIQLMFSPTTKRSSAALLSSLLLLTACNEESSLTSDETTEESSSTASSAFTYSAYVDHSSAQGASYVLTQPQTNLSIEGSVNNDKYIEVEIPATASSDYPLQISVTLGSDIFKFVSDDVRSLRKVTQFQASSAMAQSTTVTTQTTDEITLQTTVEYAIADSDYDGVLSNEELTAHTEDSVSGEHEQKVQDLMIAYTVIHSTSSTHMYKNTYNMMGKFLNDEKSMDAFFASNVEQVNSAKQELFEIATETNEEASSFLRLNASAWPLKDQSLSYDQQPWACVDDIRSVSIRNYGVRLWDASVSDQVSYDNLEETVTTSNSESTCNVNSWRLPTVEELSGLFTDGAVTYPKTFPTFKVTNSYWAKDTEENIVLVTFTNGDAETQSPQSTDQAQLALHSFEAYDVWFNIPSVETPVDTAALREQYSQPISNWPQPTIDVGVEWQELGLKPAVPFPADNPYSEQKVELGRQLFFDPRLSADDTVSCASCHMPENGWADAIRLPVGIGGQKGVRNTPTIINTAYYETLFLDGRSPSLEEQSLHPISDPIEMGLSHDDLLVKLDAIEEYAPLFLAAFGDSTITLDHIAKALATFERTIISQDSAFDKFVQGDSEAMTDEQIHGLHLFRTKARCMNCHNGPMFTNHQFENIGLTYYGRSLEDRGRFNVTFDPSDMGKMRVPMLRDIKATDPTTHLGLFKLATVSSSGNVTGLLAMYNNGMTRNRSGNFPQYAYKYDENFPEVSPLIERLAMTNEELIALNEFLTSISAEVRTDSATKEEMGIN